MTLRSPTLGKKIITLEKVDSTNSYAANLRDEEEGTIVLADEQTAGRGRQGRVWISEPGKNLTFSIILRPGAPADSGGIISLCVALGVAEALGSIPRLVPECKWPNDVLLGGRKVCGILSESAIERGRLSTAIVGVGLNVNQDRFPMEIQPPPTSLLLEAGHPFDLTAVLTAVLGGIQYRYGDFCEGRYDVIIREWKKHSGTIGRMLSVRTGGTEIRGLAKGIAADGGLILEENGTERKILAADITVLS